MTRYRLGGLLLVLGMIAQHSHGAMRCGSSLVNEGAWPIEVAESCGEPDYVAEYPTATIPGLGVVQTEEHWYYNRGPQRFIQRLIFRNGKLTSAETQGYGFHTPQNGDCSSRTLRQADSEYELIARCGEPMSKNVEWQFPPGQRTRHWQSSQPVLVQEWLYGFSNTQFRQVVTLRNGRITQVESRASR
ncbi:DUF2845 domain-containing protein [Marinobacter sp.]|uniref:DUF2845 domain-containing protein n=1 Tax=Marinobacter sp. TaxID=50741 RepID=UPI0034A39688